MSERFLNKLRTTGNWHPDLDDEHLWANFCLAFQAADYGTRHETLKAMDEQEVSRHVTKESAAQLMKRRQLGDIHELLWRAGR
jgi:hypothetical protein